MFCQFADVIFFFFFHVKTWSEVGTVKCMKKVGAVSG